MSQDGVATLPWASNRSQDQVTFAPQGPVALPVPSRRSVCPPVAASASLAARAAGSNPDEPGLPPSLRSSSAVSVSKIPSGSAARSLSSSRSVSSRTSRSKTPAGSPGRSPPERSSPVRLPSPARSPGSIAPTSAVSVPVSAARCAAVTSAQLATALSFAFTIAVSARPIGPLRSQIPPFGAVKLPSTSCFGPPIVGRVLDAAAP